MDSITLTRPDDWHLHLREGDSLASVLPHTARCFGRAIVMPNLKSPITTTKRALDYRELILAALPENSRFEPLMTLYLTDDTPPEEIARAKLSGRIHGVKLYPAGATTHSDAGVTRLSRCFHTLEKMQELGIPLLIHGEVTAPEIDIFDREKAFLEMTLGPLVERFPDLKVVIEYDGAHHLTRQAQAHDARRRGLLGNDGWLMVTVVPEDVHQPHLLVQKVTSAIAARHQLSR